MFTSERHQKIIDTLHTEGKVMVKELAKQFEVSEDCIRKDLRQLEFQGKCIRQYGGAVLNDLHPEHNVFSRIDKNTNDKEMVAQKAFNLIQDGETIFLDISTTNLILAHKLANSERKLIVVSNMIEILTVLSQNPHLTVIGTGGNVNLELNGFVGSITLNMVRRHNFSRSFIGTTGIDYANNQLTTFDMEDGLIKELVINNSEKTYVVMEKAKFKMVGTYKYIDIDNIDFIISNNDVELSYRNYLKEHQVELL